MISGTVAVSSLNMKKDSPVKIVGPSQVVVAPVAASGLLSTSFFCLLFFID